MTQECGRSHEAVCYHSLSLVGVYLHGHFVRQIAPLILGPVPVSPGTRPLHEEIPPVCVGVWLPACVWPHGT